MKNLTGRSGEYQSLSPFGERTDTMGSNPQNPFADGSNDISSSRSDESDSSNTRSGSSLTADQRKQSLVAQGGAAPPSMVSGSDLDRYPIRRSLMPPGADASNASFSRYSHSQASYDDRSQRTGSLASSVQDDNDPFLTNVDSSPFGGYPASDFPLHMDEKEADDYLHNPDPIADAAEDRRCHKLDKRGWGCLIAFIALIGGFIAVFIILPIIDFTGPSTKVSAPNEGTRLSPYSYGILKGLRTANGLVDKDTPQDVMTHTSYRGETWKLTFSDEFNVEGRTFYEGDDPIWEAPDLHYAATTDLEWYDPDAAYTEDGVLKLRMDAFANHDLYYRSGMIQSWNKFCFTQGYIEFGVRLPGSGQVLGLWPGLWTLGNLARPGFLASSEGVWPYAYNSCDVGITPNQSSSDGLSFLPGQRLNKCTCPGSNNEHPNPGTGRGAPEIDILEGTVVNGVPSNTIYGDASQSLQLAPMDLWYLVDYDFIEIHNLSITQMNGWKGGPLQQGISGSTFLNADWYGQGEARQFQKFAMEYVNDDNEGYITWYVGDRPTYSMQVGALSPNGNIDWRQISKEPMSIIMNLGISTAWTYIDWLSLRFPAVFEIDYVRLYQPDDGVSSITCDPEGFPTTDYIKNHPRAYQDANATSWEDAGYSRPKNSLMDGCST